MSNFAIFRLVVASAERCRGGIALISVICQGSSANCVEFADRPPVDS